MLDETGVAKSSAEFAGPVRSLHDAERVPCFVVVGPDGSTPSVRAAAELVLSLGHMTLPHELALVLLLEQLYRAENISRNTLYHR